MNSGVVAVRQKAAAKLNLFLHIVGRRPDGMHLIDSLVVFAVLGDAVTVRPDSALSLTRSGPMADDLPPVEDDLVLRAATALARAAGVTDGAAIELRKNLPVASGIGGGSADAAATIRALARLWRVDVPPDRLAALAQELGADVPACLQSRPSRVGGLGEQLGPAGHLPPLHAVLVNPRLAVSTVKVFVAFAAGPPVTGVGAEMAGEWSSDPRGFAQQLSGYRNDLTMAAKSLCPPIGDILAALEAQPDCLLARMSGSGATCFGLFATASEADAAAAALGHDNPVWWIAATGLDTGEA